MKTTIAFSLLAAFALIAGGCEQSTTSNLPSIQDAGNTMVPPTLPSAAATGNVGSADAAAGADGTGAH